MSTSNYLNLGAGLVLGSIMSRTIGGIFTNGIDARASMNILAVPQTRAEIQSLLDKLDVRLANGELSEKLYQSLTEKWRARLQALELAIP